MKLIKQTKQMKRKTAYFPMIVLAVCAAAMLAVYCTQVDFSNHPLDPANSSGGQDNPNPGVTTCTLTVSGNPAAGGSVTVNDSATSGTTTHNDGTSVEVCAVVNSGYTFTEWSGASSSTDSCVTVTMNQNQSLTANFQQTPATMYTLTTNVSPSGGGSVSRNPDATSYAAGTDVTVTATADSGYTFTEWSGASSSTDSCVTVTMNQNQSLTANFQQTPATMYTLTTNVSPSGGGNVSRNPDATSYAAGTDVTVTATADSEYTFTGWSDGETNTPRTITMNSNVTLTANFQQIFFTDTRDGARYRIVDMPDGKTWMADNLNYQTESGSYCYDDNPGYCDTYGRLYTWAAAMNDSLSSSANPSGVRGVCPAGWHLPSNAEWEDLANAVGGLSWYGSWLEAGSKLKSQTGWTSSSGITSTDVYGFSALPGGTRALDGDFSGAGKSGIWWSSTCEVDFVWIWSMSYDWDILENHLWEVLFGSSVRCVQD